MRHIFLLVHFLREYSFDLKGKIRSSLGDVARLREKKFGKKKLIRIIIIIREYFMHLFISNNFVAITENDYS